MESEIVEHWQHGVGMIVRKEDDCAVVLFEKDNRERVISLANLRLESGAPLVSPQLIGRSKTARERSIDALYEHIRQEGKPVFTDYPSAAKLVGVLNSQGANISSAGSITSMVSTLHKRGLIRQAEGVRGSGWIVTEMSG